MPSKHIKDEETYQALRKDGASKEKAARIANAAHNEGREAVGRKGGEAGDYEEWSKAALEKRAAEIGIDGRSSMDKGELISALRKH